MALGRTPDTQPTDPDGGWGSKEALEDAPLGQEKNEKESSNRSQALSDLTY